MLSVFLFLPIAASFVMSLTNWDLYAMASLDRVAVVGLANYEHLFSDPVFWKAMGNTAVFTLVGVPLNMALALAAALALNQGFMRFKGLFRAGFFLPVVTTTVAVAVIFRWLYNPDHGLLNWALSLVGAAPRDWLGDADLALPCLIAMAVWKGFGYNMVIFLAALQAIPRNSTRRPRSTVLRRSSSSSTSPCPCSGTRPSSSSSCRRSGTCSSSPNPT